jgi:DNA-3-methyladenine glycosylase II
MTPEITAYLAAADPSLGAVIARVGPCELRPRLDRTPFEALVRAIANQQLNGKAAECILARFLTLFPKNRFPKPADLSAISDEDLRCVGFSRAKIAALRDLAAKTLDGTVPSKRRILTLDDEEIIRRIIIVRGVGRWTVEMMLIFELGRPDVFPVDDFGVRTGVRMLYGLPDLPKPREMASYGERWRPHRSVATWYLWRAVEAARSRS